jgi:SAM-dependent methyltransferase
MSASGAPQRCRLCAAPLDTLFVDLGATPLCESYLDVNALRAPEPHFPLRVYVCKDCLLVQTEDFERPEVIFSHYAYFSSYSTSWLEHARRFVSDATVRFGLDRGSFVVEVASNDGYLLRNFVASGVPVLGIDPAGNVAEAARDLGVPTLTDFFGLAVAERVVAEQGRADLVVANNVLAHVPDVHDFCSGVAALLAPSGVATFEFPHLLRLIEERQFDTIYHEHFSYLSLAVVERLFAEHGLAVFDVERLSTHGGSLRAYAAHRGVATPKGTARVAEIRAEESAFGLDSLDTYRGFQRQVVAVKHALLELLLRLAAQGRQVVGYGAPGKGNTLLNVCGIGPDLLSYTVDRNPHKQGKFLPGSRIPIYAPERLAETRPDDILILPWNLQTEIVEQLAYARDWGARFLVPIPVPGPLP